MIVCSCRNISSKNYTAEELYLRLMEKDAECCSCQKGLEPPKELRMKFTLKDKINYNIQRYLK